MWTRKQLKTDAKAVLRNCYWKAFAVSLISVALMGNADKLQISMSGTDIDTMFYNIRQFFVYGINDIDVYDILVVLPAIIELLLFGVSAMALVLCLRIFLGMPFEVGAAKFFTEAGSGNDNLNNVAFAFQSGNYKNIVKGMFLRALYTVLWTLLFIIPGIIKSYAYSMVPYIMADNPDITPKKAMKISEMMTNGHKLNMLVLDLSFVGWYILGGFVFGVGVMFVTPYYLATYAQLYTVLRNDIFARAKSTTDYYGEETKNIPESVEKEFVYDQD